jgi:hypothetical protein
MKTISRREAVLMGAGVTLCLAVGDIDCKIHRRQGDAGRQDHD